MSKPKKKVPQFKGGLREPQSGLGSGGADRAHKAIKKQKAKAASIRDIARQANGLD